MQRPITELSVLIPTYNNSCTALVEQLSPLLEAAGIRYEIIVADDGSTDGASVEANRRLADFPHCQYMIKVENAGSAATRNFLARQSHYAWLLFLDCDIELPSDQFITRYLTFSTSAPVVNGGLQIVDDARLRTNLRYRYEQSEAPNHTAQQRQQRPYQSFRSTNFLIRRDVMLQCPFDERFRRSGYEDVYFGKQLRQRHIGIAHIDNPVLMTEYEPNAAYVKKTENSLHTLYAFRQELRGYSRLLTFVCGIHIPAILWLIRLWHRLFKRIERHNLCSAHPYLFVFKLYRLGYFLTITR